MCWRRRLPLRVTAATAASPAAIAIAAAIRKAFSRRAARRGRWHTPWRPSGSARLRKTLPRLVPHSAPAPQTVARLPCGRAQQLQQLRMQLLVGDENVAGLKHPLAALKVCDNTVRFAHHEDARCDVPYQ